MNWLTFRALWTTILSAVALFATILVAPLAFAVEIPNPIKAQSFEQLVVGIADALQLIALVFAPVALIIAGFKFITAANSGNASELTKARQMFFWILIGTAIVVGATVLAKAMVEFARTL